MLSLRFPLPPPKPKLSSLPKSTPLYPISIKRPPSRLTPSRLSLFDSTVSTSVEEELRSRATDARVSIEAEDEREGVLSSGLRREFMPNHVAVIMDGNVRWARKRGSPSSVGHEAGVRSLKQLIQLCCEWGIRVLIVFAFSYDNWNRPKMEIEFLMNLFERGIESDLENFVRQCLMRSWLDFIQFTDFFLALLCHGIHFSDDSSTNEAFGRHHIGKAKKSFRFLPAAGPLTAVVLGTAFVKIFHPSTVSVVGDIPQGLPKHAHRFRRLKDERVM